MEDNITLFHVKSLNTVPGLLGYQKQMGGCLGGCMGGQVGGWADGWADGWWTDGWVGGWIDEWLDGRTGIQVDGWICG